MHVNDLGVVIKNRRRLLNVTQQQLSELTEIGLRTIKGIEAGNTNPTLSTIATILETLGLELSIKTLK